MVVGSINQPLLVLNLNVMTALEKASQLIVDYQLSVRSLDYDEAVQCSIRTVDAIIEALNDNGVSFRDKYWQEVRHWLEKQVKKMTPKEKAKELVYKFDNCMEFSTPQRFAKQCALIAVKEILRVASYADDSIYDHFLEVKQEIEKL
jgi:hypothetical protein